MTDPNGGKVREPKLVEFFAKSTWISLGLAVFCLGVDAYAVVYLPLSFTSEERHLFRPSTGFLISLWTAADVVALLACWLLQYAFPDRPANPRTIDRTTAGACGSVASRLFSL